MDAFGYMGFFFALIALSTASTASTANNKVKELEKRMSVLEGKSKEL